MYPTVGSVWKHKKTQTLYEVKSITNRGSGDHNKFPVTIVYTRMIDGTEWSRPYNVWRNKFVPLEQDKQDEEDS